MEWLLKLIAMIPAPDASIVAIIATVLEFVLRLFPTEKPKSILWLVKDFCVGLANLFGKIAALLDKLLPQKLVENKPQ